MDARTPDWVKHAVFYQIFPDRFARSSRTHHPDHLKLKPWGTPPEEQGFQGGDLRGIVDKLDYLDDLGVTALYLNPIFASASNHRYHTYDYMEVDPLLGGDDALRELLDAAHDRDMRVVLDGVFNHASRGFWAFHHILENGGNSPYIDWFVVHDWPLRPYAAEGEDHNYAAWAGLPALPEFNVQNEGVRSHLLDVARHWVEFGIDGWRLDVPNEIDDADFWRAFRDVVKDANPEAYICGEIWEEAPSWLEGDQFDAVMNYQLLDPILSFFGADTLIEYNKPHLRIEPMEAPAFVQRVEEVNTLYDWPITQAQLNLIDSHDMARALHIMGDDKEALRLAALFQMTMPGAPCIYYGDEIGLSSGDDPYCREAFPWDDEEAWDHDLLAFYQQATRLRHDHAVLRTGRVETLHAEGRTCAFRRTLDGQEAVVGFNAGGEPTALTLDAGRLDAAAFNRVWPPEADAQPTTENGSLHLDLPARQGCVLVSGD